MLLSNDIPDHPRPRKTPIRDGTIPFRVTESHSSNGIIIVNYERDEVKPAPQIEEDDL